MGRGPVHRLGPSGRRRRVVDGRMGKRKQKIGGMGRDEWRREGSRGSDRGDETVGRREVCRLGLASRRWSRHGVVGFRCVPKRKNEGLNVRCDGRSVKLKLVAKNRK